MAADIRFGEVQVSVDAPPVFLPDIDVYFKGNVTLALELVEKLKSAQARVIKGALIHDLEICFDGAVEATYYKPGTGLVHERYRDVLQRHLLSLPDAATIYGRVRDLGMEVILTAYDRAGVDFALSVGAAALKVASSNITHAPLIRYMSRQRVPLLIDTGRSTRNEIAQAVNWARDAGAEKLIIQHSPVPPPAALDDHHLRMIPELGRIFGCPAGLSDHHAGNEMMFAAVALGAVVIEKGVCADTATDDIDLAHAARISEIPSIISGIEGVWRALGKSMRELPPDRPRPADRMGLVAAKAIAVGDKLTEANVRFALAVPEDTVPVECWDEVAGRSATQDISAGSAIAWRALGLNR